MSSASQLDKAYLYIRQQIEMGMIRPGQSLSRRKLAEEIGVSSALVQQALAQLDRERITESRPRSGTYVRELSEKEFSDLCDIRELLEPHAAACAAERITADDLQILRESCSRYQALKSEQRWDGNPATAWLHRCQTIREELVFHGTILRASGNEILTNLVSTLRLIGQVSPGLVYENGEDHENSPLVIACEHEGIVEALEARDPELARERMLNHIRGARILIRSTFSDSATESL
ncbi:GntR family transcriptional regulator [Planctomicrobium sp. SH661]|uniref:GntR family transcriptional regulator n=1 Tax=Planctomicrobium sp. SH661 TaxID=3448124 RepID=UPI003F5B1396